MLLFVDRRKPSAAAAEAQFSAVRWPPGTVPEVVDVATDDERTSWYGISDVPAVAVVCDGALLAIEHECSEAACTRVCKAASERDPRVLDGWFFRVSR